MYSLQKENNVSADSRSRQTSLRSGLLQEMGKGFLAAHGLIGQDLGDLIQNSCSRNGLNVQLNAIVNDSSATLLSKAYLDQTTRFALILGTGVNAAVHLPVHMFKQEKFGIRPASWHESAKHVIVNTELSMFGSGILPYTRWDKALLATHSRPDFQPLEHFVSGGYLGEISRLILVEGIEKAGLLGGIVPPSLVDRYSLETETLSHVES
jgi:hexokinase